MDRIVDLIRRKRNGEELALEELERLINGYIRAEISDAQMAAFLMAGTCNGFNDAEAAALTAAMLRCGQRVDLSAVPKAKVDYHSTGGVGDKISLIRRAGRRGLRAGGSRHRRTRHRSHGRNPGQAPVDPRVPHPTRSGRLRRPGNRIRAGVHRTEQRVGPRGQAFVRSARSNRNRQLPSVDRGFGDVEEARRGARRPRPRRQGRQGIAARGAHRGPPPGAVDDRHRPADWT